MTISVELGDTERDQLVAVAARLIENLAEAATRDVLTRQADNFAAAAQRVLNKNREIYR